MNCPIAATAFEVMFRKGNLLSDDEYQALWKAIEMCEKMEMELDFESMGWQEIPFEDDPIQDEESED
jgi:hypothetical protein